jgi:hypothetical protein
MTVIPIEQRLAYFIDQPHTLQNLIITWAKFLSNHYSRFIRPCSCNISHCITTTTKNQRRQIELLHKVNAVGVTFWTLLVNPMAEMRNCVALENSNTFHRQVEATQFVATEGITTTLQDNSGGSIPFHHLFNNLRGRESVKCYKLDLQEEIKASSNNKF